MRLLDTLIRRKLPVGPDAPDADAPDAFTHTLLIVLTTLPVSVIVSTGMHPYYMANAV